MDASSAPNPKAEVLGTRWVLRSIGSVDVSALGVDMQISDGHVVTSDGCNRLRLPFKVDQRSTGDWRFDLTKAATTMMACEGLANVASRAFAPAAAAVRLYRVHDDSLEFLDAAGTTMLRYTRQPNHLVGLVWHAQGINIHGGVETSARVARASIHLGSDGFATVHTSCEKLKIPFTWTSQGEIDFDDNKLKAHATCAQLGDVGSIHLALVLALRRVSQWQRVGDLLELRSDNTALQFLGSMRNK